MLVLTFEGEKDGDGKGNIINSLINIVKNPIIIGIVLGVAASLLKIDFPEIIDKTLASLAKMASPLALITIGAGFEGRKAIAKIKPTIAATMIKLVVLPAVFLPIAIKLGFRDQALVALIIMLAHRQLRQAILWLKIWGTRVCLHQSVVIATTLMSSLCLTFWILLRGTSDI